MTYGEDILYLLLVLFVMISNKESKPMFQNYLEMELQSDGSLPDSLISAAGGYGHMHRALHLQWKLLGLKGVRAGAAWNRVLTEEGKSRVTL